MRDGELMEEGHEEPAFLVKLVVVMCGAAGTTLNGASRTRGNAPVDPVALLILVTTVRWRSSGWDLRLAGGRVPWCRLEWVLEVR